MICLSSPQRLMPGMELPALPPADLLLVTSSAEIGMLAAPTCRPWLRALVIGSPHAPLHMLSIGCAGVAACVLEFVHSNAQRAHVLVIESPANWVQSALDAAGVGVGGDGFEAQDIGYVFTLSRGEAALPLRPGDTRVLHCSLLSREPGIAGTARLASQFVHLMAALRGPHAGLRMVTFENGSQWSLHLARLVDTLAMRERLPGRQHWLASQETDRRHYMTARPLLDLQAHAAAVQDAPLLLPCLGAGGRLGLLLLGAGSTDAATLHLPEVQPLDLPPPEPVWLAEPAHCPPRSVLYSRREYFGRSQFYFRWRLTREHLRHA